MTLLLLELPKRRPRQSDTTRKEAYLETKTILEILECSDDLTQWVVIYDSAITDLLRSTHAVHDRVRSMRDTNFESGRAVRERKPGYAQLHPTWGHES